MDLETVTRSNHHYAIFGRTGGGKTYLAETLYRECDTYAVFLNIQHEHVRGKKFYTWDKNFLNENRKINLCPNLHENRLIFKAKCERVAYDLMEVGFINFPNARPKKPYINLYVDEAHNLIPQGDMDNYLLMLLRQGKRFGIRVIIISQNPVTVNKSARMECDYHIQFALNKQNQDYYVQHGIPFEEIKRKLSEQYAFVIWDGTANEEDALSKAAKLPPPTKPKRKTKSR